MRGRASFLRGRGCRPAGPTAGRPCRYVVRAVCAVAVGIEDPLRRSDRLVTIFSLTQCPGHALLDMFFMCVGHLRFRFE